LAKIRNILQTSKNAIVFLSASRGEEDTAEERGGIGREKEHIEYGVDK